MAVGQPKITNYEMKFSFQPKQRDLWNLVSGGKKTRIGYGGSRGGSKSKGGRDVMLKRRIELPKTAGLIIRRTFPQLHANHVVPLFMDFPELRPYYNKQEKVLTLPNGSILFFGHAEHVDDIYNYRGWEFLDILVEEATDFEEEQIVFLTTINRHTGDTKANPVTIYTMNPGGIGHFLMKRWFIDKDYTQEEKPYKDKFAFIQAYAWDNIEWVRPQLIIDGYTPKQYYKEWTDDDRRKYFLEHSDYGKNLNALPEDKRKAELFGDWNVYSGVFFTEYRREYHIIPDTKPKENYTIAGAIDYGRDFALEIGFKDYMGNVIIFSELAFEHETPKSSAYKVAEFLKTLNLGRFLILCDTNMASSVEYHGADKAPIEIFREVFREVLGMNAPVLDVVSKKSPDKRDYRKVCNEVFKDYLHWERNPNWKEGSDEPELKVKPRLYICESVTELPISIQSLQHKKDGDGLDFDPKIGKDHAYDAAKYLLMFLRDPYKETPKPKPKSEREMIEGIFERVQQESLKALRTKKRKFELA